MQKQNRTATEKLFTKLTLTHVEEQQKEHYNIAHTPEWRVVKGEVTGVGGCHCYLFVVLARLSVSIRDMSTIQLGKRQLTTGAANEMVKGSLPGLKSVGGSEEKLPLFNVEWPLPNL